MTKKLENKCNFTNYEELILEFIIWGVTIAISFSHLLVIVIKADLSNDSVDDVVYEQLIKNGALISISMLFIVISYATSFLCFANMESKYALVLGGGIFVLVAVGVSIAIQQELMNDSGKIDKESLKKWTWGLFIFSILVSLVDKVISFRVNRDAALTNPRRMTP